MGNITATESVLPNNQIEQKVHDSFKNYPIATQKGIMLVLEQQRENWQRLRNSPNDFFLQAIVGSGIAYSTNIPSAKIPKHALSAEEAQKHQAFLDSLAPYKLSNTYGISANGVPNTRFYLSLRDSKDTIQVMNKLTQRLIDLQKNRIILFFQYKFDSFDEDRQLRFDPAYRDKGASPILYVADKDVDLTQQLLDNLAQQHPNAFLAQKAPFKYSPHDKESDEWHISMEANNLGNTSTPEQGMKKAVSQFLVGLGLTNAWIPVQSLHALDVRNAWKQAVTAVNRDPQKPWIATDRTPPNLLAK